MVKMIKKLITTALALSLCISSVGTFAFAAETEGDAPAAVNVSLIKYSGSASIDEDDEYEGATVSIDGVTRPVLTNVKFQLLALEDGEYISVKDGLVTDENGYLIVKDLPADAEYYFQETAPAEGYILEDEYVKAIPWTDEEVITYAVSTKRELPPDEYIDESFEEPEEEFTEPEDTSDQESSQGEEDEAGEESPKTGDNSFLLILVAVFAAASAAVCLLKKKA